MDRADQELGWLLGAVHDHRIPTTRPTTRRDRATDRLRLSLEQLDGMQHAMCTPLRAPVSRRLARDASFGVEGAILVQSVPRTGVASEPLPFGASLLATAPTHTLRAVTGPLVLRIVPASPNAALC